MRVLFTFIMAIGVIYSTMANDAGNLPEKAPVSLRKVDQNKVQLLYGILPEGTVTVKIYDANNALVQKDRITAKTAFARYYDVSQLTPGNYTMEVIDGTSVVDYLQLQVNPASPAPVIYSRLEKVENNSYKLLVNSLLPTAMSVLVFENDRLVHEEKLNDVSGFQKLYKLQGISPTAKVEFFVKTNEGYAKTLAIR
ncbi:hypothetical protein [Fontibacter flavus]|uniref:Por secretion system C-terminal sorting domain-containing protein n=1 Tax=Fontibacter flavus TaxID=654838 RepID=A0ABV6FVN6_9BACT